MAEVVLMEVGFGYLRVADAVDGDLLAFDCLAVAGGRPVDKRHDLFTVRHGICHLANQDINPGFCRLLGEVKVPYPALP